MDAQAFWEIIYFPVTLDDLYIDNLEDYLEFIFPVVTLITVIAAAVLSFIFYNFIGNITMRMATKTYWFLFMILAGFVGFYTAIDKVKEILYFDVPIESDGWIFAFTVFVWGMIYYLLFSLLFKTRYFSKYANQIPFKTNW